MSGAWLLRPPALCTCHRPQELLGSLWMYVRLEAPSLSEQFHMVLGCFPDILPLLPVGMAMLELLQLAAGHTSPLLSSSSLPSNASPEDSSQEQQQQQQQPRRCWWHTAALSALAAAGIRPGDLSLSLGRHFSVRDLFKWAQRMQGHPCPPRLQQVLGPTAQAVCSAYVESSSLAPAVPGYSLQLVDVGLRAAGFVEGADVLAALVAREGERRRLLWALASLWSLPNPQQAVERCVARVVWCGRGMSGFAVFCGTETKGQFPNCSFPMQ